MAADAIVEGLAKNDTSGAQSSSGARRSTKAWTACAAGLRVLRRLQLRRHGPPVPRSARPLTDLLISDLFHDRVDKYGAARSPTNPARSRFRAGTRAVRRRSPRTRPRVTLPEAAGPSAFSSVAAMAAVIVVGRLLAPPSAPSAAAVDRRSHRRIVLVPRSWTSAPPLSDTSCRRTLLVAGIVAQLGVILYIFWLPRADPDIGASARPCGVTSHSRASCCPSHSAGSWRCICTHALQPATSPSHTSRCLRRGESIRHFRYGANSDGPRNERTELGVLALACAASMTSRRGACSPLSLASFRPCKRRSGARDPDTLAFIAFSSRGAARCRARSTQIEDRDPPQRPSPWSSLRFSPPRSPPKGWGPCDFGCLLRHCHPA